MSDKRGRPLILSGLLLLLTALVLTVYNAYDGYRAAFVSQQTVVFLEQTITPKAPYVPQPEIPIPETEHLSREEVEIPDYLLDPTMEMPVVTFEEHDYIGTMSIPALELHLPIINQWSDPALKIAPCRYAGTAYDDGFVIAGHNYRAHFAQLSALEAGDRILFTDVDGNTFSYDVVARETLPPTAIEDMISEDWALTLFTCTVGGSNRVALRCDRAAD